jgi:hypothetical protein
MNMIAVRRAKDAEQGPLDLFKVMKAGKRYRVIYDCAKETMHMVATRRKSLRRARSDMIPKHACIPLFIKNAKWYSPGTLTDRQKRMYTSKHSGSNVFGESGIVRIHRKHSFQLPRVNILSCEKSMYEMFGIRVFKPNDPLPTTKSRMYMVSYNIRAHYATQYIHHKRGPGIFLEHHDFAHYLMPLSRASHGPFVIGKFKNGKDSSGGIYLMGIEVPAGYILYVPPHTIHNDWYFVGKLATTVTNTESDTVTNTESDTVFVRGDHGKRIAMSFLSNPGGVRV